MLVIRMPQQSSSTHYQSLARRYRPQTFQNVCDQQVIVTTLKNAIALERVSHAYLFTGPRGVGKTTLARLFAKALNCEHLSSDYEPCNECSSCRDITSGQALDVLEIDGASNRGIDDIRELNETILYTPSASRYKIYIIDEVHMLTKEAFNALLKTLEEPPKNVKFFFATTEPHKVLPTILSRCQRFDLHRISLKSIYENLKMILDQLTVSYEEEALYTIAKCSDGSLRDAQSLLDQILCASKLPKVTFAQVAALLGLSSHEVLFSLDQAFAQQDLATALRLAKTLYEEGRDLLHFLENLADHYQTILKYHLGALTLSTLPQAYQDSYVKAATIYTKEDCLYLLEYLIPWIDKLHKIPCQEIHLELILLHIIRSKQRVAIEDLIHQLQELKKPPLPKPSPETPKELLPPPPNIQDARIQDTRIEDKPIQDVSVIASPAQEPISSEHAKHPDATHPDVMHQTTAHPQKYETLLRFAAVELNGILKKDHHT